MIPDYMIIGWIPEWPGIGVIDSYKCIRYTSGYRTVQWVCSLDDLAMQAAFARE